MNNNYEQRNAYKIEIEQVLLRFGFTFDGHGCMCEGNPLVYSCTRGKTTFRCKVFDARGFWHLFGNKDKIGFGTEPSYLQTELTKLWDLFN